MTDDRSLERAARSWLEEGPTRAPDRAVLGALDRIQSTRQERGFRVPWRFPTMFTNRVAVAALAIVITVAGGGFALSRLASVGQGGPAPTAGVSPAPSASATAAPSPSPAGPTITTTDVHKTLQPGTYRVDGFAASFTVTLPEGWIVSDFTPNSIQLERRTDPTVNLYMAALGKMYPDPCHTSGGPTAVGPGVKALVDAFSAMPGFEMTGLKDATVGRASGKTFKFGNSIDVVADHCSGNNLPLGTYERNGQDIDVAMFGGESDQFWVVDAGGKRLFLAVTGSNVDTLRPLMDSLSFLN